MAGDYRKSDRGDLQLLGSSCAERQIFFRVFAVFCVYVYICRSEKMGKMMKLELYFLLGQLCQLEKVDKLLGLQVLLRV